MTRRSPDDPISADPLDRNRFPVHEWEFTEAEYITDDLGVTESLFAVGNGYLGMRGNVEEVGDLHHGTFINGFHETWPIRHAEEAFGFAHEWARPSSMCRTTKRSSCTSMTSRCCCR